MFVQVKRATSKTFLTIFWIVILVTISSLVSYRIGKSSYSCRLEVKDLLTSNDSTEVGMRFNASDPRTKEQYEYLINVKRRTSYHDQELVVNQNIVWWHLGNREWYADGWTPNERDTCVLDVVKATALSSDRALDLVSNSCRPQPTITQN